MNDIDNTQHQSVTATVCENAQLFGATPERDEFDPREVWDEDVAFRFRVAGAGFARHRAAHCAVPSCPHKCGHFRPSLRQRAARDCLRLRPRRPPLNRRGGSPPPASPASIPPSLSRSTCRSLPPGAAFFSHPTHR